VVLRRRRGGPFVLGLRYSNGNNKERDHLASLRDGRRVEQIVGRERNQRHTQPLVSTSQLGSGTV
jgi:hypothetical protein